MASNDGANPPRLPSQGGNTTAHTQIPYGFGAPKDTETTPMVDQPYRGYAPAGVGAASSNGSGNRVPQ